MSYTETIKTAFSLVNARWQLIVVQAVMMLMNCIGFFIMVGIPLGIAFIIFGLDLTGLSGVKDIVEVIKNPAELVSKYLGLIMIIVCCFLLYVAMVATAGLYVFSGSIGIIGRGILDPASKFSSKNFFSEARRFFFPIMWYSLLVGIVFLVITFALGLFGGGIAAVVSSAKGQDSTLALFLGIFFSLVLVLIGLSVILGTLAVTVYGIAVLFFRGEGAVASFKAAFWFLWNKQQAFWLYVLLLSGYILMSFFVLLIVYPLYLIPIFGTIVSFPFQIAQSYLGLIILAAVFHYYYESDIRPSLVTAQEPQKPLNADMNPDKELDQTPDQNPAMDAGNAAVSGSTNPEDTSSPEDRGPAPSPVESGPTGPDALKKDPEMPQ